MIDYTDSKLLWKFALDNVRIAQQYRNARNKYATALKELKLELAKSYNNRSIDRKHTEQKAYLILSEQNPECRKALMELIDAEHQYKGLEKVLEARQAALSFNQSLIRNTPK